MKQNTTHSMVTLVDLQLLKSTSWAIIMYLCASNPPDSQYRVSIQEFKSTRPPLTPNTNGPMYASLSSSQTSVSYLPSGDERTKAVPKPKCKCMYNILFTMLMASTAKPEPADCQSWGQTAGSCGGRP